MRNREDSNFLVILSSFHENVLRFLIKRKFCQTSVRQPWKDIEREVWRLIKQSDEGRIYQYLKAYRSDDVWQRWLQQELSNRPILTGILKFYPEFSPLIQPLESLERYCQQRNESVHQLEGVSYLDNPDRLKANLLQIVRNLTQIPSMHPFDSLNKKICSVLDNFI